MPRNYNLPFGHQLPDVSQVPPNQYSLDPTQPDKSQVVSWPIADGEFEATLGYIDPEFEFTIEMDKGGEQITLVDAVDDTVLSAEVLDDKGNVEVSQTLSKDNPSAEFPGSKDVRFKTGAAKVGYLCVYPGKPTNVK